MPEAVEGQHMGHPDFRVKGRIFASLFHAKGRKDFCGMVILTPAQQCTFMAANRGVFEPYSGAWGRAGATQVELGEVTARTAREAVIAAWRKTAPTRLVHQFDAGDED